MEFETIESLPGSPEPGDIFEPHMPGVDVLSDMDAFFADIRHGLETADVESASGDGRLIPGQRGVAIVTPGRSALFIPAPPPGSMSRKNVESAKRGLRANKILKISVISYTKLEAVMEDKEKTKCIPFLGHLISFAYLGHNVVVFEGHPSALESGIRNSDLLIIDSGMMPFLQENWADIAYQVMAPDARIMMHERDSYSLLSIIKTQEPPGWQVCSEEDGESSYVNCLVTTLAKEGSGQTIKIVTGGTVPDLATLTKNPKELDWISKLPFNYKQLNAAEVIKILLQTKSGLLGMFKSTWTFDAKLAMSQNRLVDVSFKLKLIKMQNGKNQLEIKFQKR